MCLRGFDAGGGGRTRLAGGAGRGRGRRRRCRLLWRRCGRETVMIRRVPRLECLLLLRLVWLFGRLEVQGGSYRLGGRCRPIQMLE
jgi:hypothetical protein